LSARRSLPALAVGLGLAIVAVLAAFSVGDAARDERRVRLEQRADVEVARIEASLERDLVEMERLANAGLSVAAFRQDAQARIDKIPELVAVALADVDGRRVVVRTAVPNDRGLLAAGTDLAASDDLDIVLTRAVTEADAAAGTPFEINGRDVIAVAAPIVDAGTVGAEAARRDGVVGVIVGAIEADVVLAQSWPGSMQLVAPDGRSAGEPAKGEFAALPLDVRGRTWTLLLDVDFPVWPGRAWAVLAIGLTLSAGTAIAFERQLRRRRQAEAQARSRSLQLERIAEAGTRLQQSLDLAELLPTFSVALANDFDLQAVSVALVDDDGALIEAFATGDRPDGASLDLPLRRGWRAVGVLSVRPGRPLDDAELTSLQALADLLAVAMSNAQLYEREQLNAARLRDLDALKNAFLGTVSHELRTSMTAIMGFGELLADSWENLDEARRREMANRIRRSAGSLRHLVDDLLDFARLEQERLRVSPRSIDLTGAVRQTVDGLSPLLGHHELVLRLDDAVAAWADPVAVERILANLVSNAAKYSPAGATVTISVSANGSTARLTVADQGPGIPAEERKRIFARFYRLDTPESVRTRGAGIGLAILQDFAERSGAIVAVDDAPGGGAQFTIDFPTAPPVTDELAVAR
jgi:signal transduction histidine kinase